MHVSDLSRATWRKSSYSNGSGGSCVEITELPGPASEYQIAVRDSKDPNGPVLAFTASGWRAFTEGIKTGEFEFL